MKKIPASLIFIFITGIALAQDFDLGGKIGVNYSQSIISNVISSGDVSTSDLENETGAGIVFGGFVRGTFNKLIIQPELLFSDSKTYIKINDISVDDIYSTKISKVDVPVLIGYNVFKTFHVLAGPVFSNIKDTDSETLLQFDHITVGYQAGLGFDVGKLTFDIRYEGNLSKFENYIETENGSISFDARKNIFQFTLGYKLFD